MPEALATTKRKFYKALDALTNSSQTSLDKTDGRSAEVGQRQPTAAIAFDQAQERARKRLRASGSTASFGVQSADSPRTSLTSPRPIKIPAAAVASRTSGGALKRTPPSYSPWSQEMFLGRLKSFSSVSKWHPKPDAINEVEWAKRGWSCVEVNTIACKGGCERRVVVIMDVATRGSIEDDDEEEEDSSNKPDDMVSELESALVEKYQDLIVQGHAESCMWHKAGCKDDIYRLSVVRSSIWQPELRERFQSLLSISKSISDVVVTTSEQPQTGTKDISALIKDLPQILVSKDEIASPIASKAMTMAANGWRGMTESGNELLRCDACFQRIGLWMYQPHYVSKSRNPNERAANDMDSSQVDRDEDVAHIDTLEMHREHCPWRSAASQQAVGTFAGLNASQVLLRMMENCARDHRRRSGEILQPETVVDHEPDSDDPPVQVRSSATRDEIAKQDKERESRIRKLKNMFNIKRRTPKISANKAPV